jgi:C-methyltransferase C-terminal domain
LKIGKCMPGTLIPVVEESRMFEDQPDCAIIFSWHIAAELAPKLRAKGFKGKLDHAIADAKFPLKGMKACPLDSNPRRSDSSAEAA